MVDKLPDYTQRGKELIALIRERIIVLDGGMGTMLQSYNLKASDFGGSEYEGCNENLNLTRPDVVRQIHEAYYKAGSDMVETNTFGSMPTVLSEYNLADRSAEISEAAARIAREAAANY